MESERVSIEEVKDLLCLVVVKLWGMKMFIEGLKSQGRLGEYPEKERDELMDTLDSIEYLLQMTSLLTHADVTEGEVQVEDVPEVRDNTEAGLNIMRQFLDCLESEGRLEEFLEEKMDEFDDSLNNLVFLLEIVYLFTYEAGLAIINEIRDCIDNDN